MEWNSHSSSEDHLLLYTVKKAKHLASLPMSKKVQSIRQMRKQPPKHSESKAM